MNKSPEKRNFLENQQILEVLRGNTNINDILKTNSNLNTYIDDFNNLNPKNKIEYQGILSVKFRDFLIEQPEIKSQINELMKENGLYKGENNTGQVYDYKDDFYEKHGRGPSTLELYQKFLNYKSYELRGKINIIRSHHPHYYQKKS